MHWQTQTQHCVALPFSHPLRCCPGPSQAAAASLDIVDAFFKQLISKFHGGLSGKEAARDFELPANSDACHKLLGDGRNVLESYAVY